MFVFYFPLFSRYDVTKVSGRRLRCACAVPPTKTASMATRSGTATGFRTAPSSTPKPGSPLSPPEYRFREKPLSRARGWAAGLETGKTLLPVSTATTAATRGIRWRHRWVTMVTNLHVEILIYYYFIFFWVLITDCSTFVIFFLI